MASASIRKSSAIACLAAALAAASCGGGSPLGRWTPQRSPHEDFAESLRSANLDASAAGQAWLARAREALERPHAVTLPFQESGYVDPAVPSAVGYRFDLPRGRAISIDVSLEAATPARWFVDLFLVNESGAERVASAAEGRTDLHHVSRGGSYILRLQPELLGGGRYTITQRSEATLRFPVQGVGERAIQSVFGDARDGGRRDHHGVDIFAPRGTPVVAAADGIVRRVNTTDIGGRVVWLADSTHGQSLYYAHLDNWAVQQGAEVKAGEVLGYVGNTGNARSTPPHLHFGVYSGGPIDPLPFIRASDGAPPRVSPEPALIGRWGRTTSASTEVRAALARDSATVATLPAATPLHLRAAAISSFRVALPDGREGFVSAAGIVSLDRPVRTARMPAGAVLRAAPSDAAVIVQTLDDETRVRVYGTFEQFLLTRLSAGTRGWVRPPSGS